MIEAGGTLLGRLGLLPAALPRLAMGAECIALQLADGIPTDCLDAGERQRLFAYGNPATAQRFAASRVLLRAVLSHYLSCPPSALAYARQAHGKPVLAAPFTGQLHFSLARRDGWCALAFSRDCPVGVDIERVRELAGMEDVARLYFSASDNAALNLLSGAAKRKRFFELWTALEASRKRDGLGLGAVLETRAAGSDADVTHHYPAATWMVAVAS